MQGALPRDCSPPGQGWELWVVGRSSLVAEVPQPLPPESWKGPLECGSHGILTPDGDWRGWMEGKLSCPHSSWGSRVVGGDGGGKARCFSFPGPPQAFSGMPLVLAQTVAFAWNLLSSLPRPFKSSMNAPSSESPSRLLWPTTPSIGQACFRSCWAGSFCGPHLC